MEIDTKILGEKAFVVVLDDYDIWEVLAGEIIGVIVSVEKTRRENYHTWIQYKVETDEGPHVISGEYVYQEKKVAEERSRLLKAVKQS